MSTPYGRSRGGPQHSASMEGRLARALSRLAAQASPSPPNLPEAPLEPNRPARHRPYIAAIAVAVAAAAVVGALVVSRTDSSVSPSSPNPSSSAPPTLSSYRDGPLVLTSWRLAGVRLLVLADEAKGVLELRNGCTWIRSRSGALSLVVWPLHATWDEDAQQVQLGARAFPLGDRFIADGPRLSLTRIRSKEPELATLIDSCASAADEDDPAVIVYESPQTPRPDTSVTPPPATLPGDAVDAPVDPTTARPPEPTSATTEH